MILLDSVKNIYSCERDKYFTLSVLSIDIIEDYEDIINAFERTMRRTNVKKVKIKKTFMIIFK